MRYKIYAENPQNHFLTVELAVENITSDRIKIQLPAWRPGRYELQNFAKNIQQFEIFDEQQNPVEFHKVNKDRWKVYTKNISKLTIRLRYYAYIQHPNGVFANAGSSYVDENTMYVNFVNCLPYVSGRMHEPCTVELGVTDEYKIASGMPIEGKTLLAQDYYQLVDSPVLASPYLQCQTYKAAGIQFYVWFLGNYQPNWEKILSDFARFSEKQIDIMGDFPEKDYHFINWILPVAFYHGVEHRNSTMIVLGPDTEGDGLYTDLLGVSSHELYHAWNICKIRPVEMMPYDFTKENYFPTGFVAEGVTTFLGDVFLKQSGVFSLDAYLNEFTTTIRRHFEQDGRSPMSLVEASMDLWLDGYSASIPNRRVSIYNKGAVVAFLLDGLIREATQHQKSIHDVMRLMWEKFGDSGLGYSLFDYKQLAEQVFGGSLDTYFAECITGNIPLQEQVQARLAWYGIEASFDENLRLTVGQVDNDNENLRNWLG